MTLSILDVIEDTTVDGPGFRTSIYAAGCLNRCPGCHNPESWDISRGKKVPVETLLEKVLADEFANVTFSGGDPFFQPEGFTWLAREIKARSNKTIWCYTGLTYEEIQKDKARSALLQYIDVLVDGRFMRELHRKDLIFRGSCNQRLIDVPMSLNEKRIVSLDYQPLSAI